MDVVEKGQLTDQQALDHWYYQAKFNLLARELGKAPVTSGGQLVDVGSGLGVYLTLLERAGIMRPDQMHGVDTAYVAPTPAILGNSLIYPEWQAWANPTFVTLMDVLEHIEDDRKALNQIVDQTPSATRFFITVPAFNWLWSQHDVLLHHHRRYSIASLRATIAACPSLQLINCYYFYAVVFPIAATIRIIKRCLNIETQQTDLRRTNKSVNAVLKSLLRLESSLANKNHIAGLTVVAVCQKH